MSPARSLRCALTLALLAPLARGQVAAPPPWAGSFSDGETRATLAPAAEGFQGTVELGGATYAARGRVSADGVLSGTLGDPERPSPMVAELEGPDLLVLRSDGVVHRLAREARRPDVSHVRAGQRYTYEMNNAGMKMQMVWEVKELTATEVKCEITVFMDFGQGVLPVGEPNPFDYPLAAPQRTNDRDAPMAPAPLRFEEVEAVGRTWRCMVTTTGNIVAWVHAPDGLPTFPGVIKMTTDGEVTQQLIRVEPELPPQDQASVEEAERAAVADLRAIVRAQTRFREQDADGDGDLDYGTLAELGRAGLIDADLATGARGGFTFDVRPSATSPRFLWVATARSPRADGRWFVTNHAGVVYAGAGPPVAVDDECAIPSGLTEVGE